MKEGEVIKKNCASAITVGLFLLAASTISVKAQDWTKIVPLVSNCGDVKRVLQIADCTLPSTKVESSKHDVYVDFSSGNDNRNLSKDTVVSVHVLFHDLLKLSEYEPDLSGYIFSREQDVPQVGLYKNDKKGIEITVQTTVAEEPYISGIYIYPSEENRKKFKYKQ